MIANRSDFILAVLQQLNQVHPLALASPPLLRGCRMGGHPKATEEDLASVLADMAEQGLVTQQASELDASVKQWKRTEKGRVVLVDNGL